MLFKLIVAYFMIINVIGVYVNVIDKKRAKKNKWRISEKALLLIAFSGGAPLSYLTMMIIHHKTRHLKFMISLPLLSVIQIAFLLYLKYIMGG